MDKLLAALMDLPPASYIAMEPKEFNPSEGFEIAMNNAGITDARSEYPILGTYGLATCMAIAVYAPQMNTGGIAHLAQSSDDPLRLSQTSKHALNGLLSAARSDPSQPLEIRIVGPYESPLIETFIKDVLKIINDIPNVHFLSADFQGKPFPTAMGIDTRRWTEGMLKGANDSGVTIYQMTRDIAAVKRFQARCAHIVDIHALPKAVDTDNALFDVRAKAIGWHSHIHKQDAITPDGLAGRKNISPGFP